FAVSGDRRYALGRRGRSSRAVFFIWFFRGFLLCGSMTPLLLAGGTSVCSAIELAESGDETGGSRLVFSAGGTAATGAQSYGLAGPAHLGSSSGAMGSGWRWRWR